MAKQRETAIKNLKDNKIVPAEIIKLISATYSDPELSVKNLASENFLLDIKDDFEGIQIKISKNADYNKFFSLFKKEFESYFVVANTFAETEDIIKGIKLSITHDNNGGVMDSSIKIDFDLFNKICESSLDQIRIKFGGLINLKTAQQRDQLRRASTFAHVTAPVPVLQRSNSEFVGIISNQQRLQSTISAYFVNELRTTKKEVDEKEISTVSTTSEEQSGGSPSLNSIRSLSPDLGRRPSIPQKNDVTGNAHVTADFSMKELQQAVAARLDRRSTQRKI